MLLKTQGIKNFLMFCLIKINKTQNEKKNYIELNQNFRLTKTKA